MKGMKDSRSKDCNSKLLKYSAENGLKPFPKSDFRIIEKNIRKNNSRSTANKETESFFESSG